MTLHELIRAHRDTIIAVWRDEAREVAAGESMPTREIVDTLPVYLDELAASLEATSSGEPLPATQQVAAQHGQTRLKIGFAPHEVVREYALLRKAILKVADEQGYAPPREELFDPFVQLGPDRSGFGLGLAIARQAVEAHGGNLAVHDDLQGKGCVFLLEIPASESAA